jgi:hypothetical protein
VRRERERTKRYSVKDLPAIAGALRELDWTVTLVYKSAADMERNLEEIAEAKHKYKMKALKKSDRTTFDRSKSVPTLEPDGTFVAGWALSPPTAAVMHGKVHAWSSSDFCSVQTPGHDLNGVLGARIVADSNRHISEIVLTRSLMNENQETWEFMNLATIKAVPNYDKNGQIDCHDGAKGAHTAHRKFANAKEARDYRHRHENILTRGK